MRYLFIWSALCACANCYPTFIILNSSHFYLPHSAGKSRSLPFLLISTLDRWLYKHPPLPPWNLSVFTPAQLGTFGPYQTYTGLYIYRAPAMHIQGPGYIHTGQSVWAWETADVHPVWRQSRARILIQWRKRLESIKGMALITVAANWGCIHSAKNIRRFYTLIVWTPRIQRVRLYY